jgi:23S rRNA pseudouridine1911/1915/1917 synthase
LAGSVVWLMKKIVIKKENVGQRLDKFLSDEFFGLSRSQIQKIIKNGLVEINGKKILPHCFLKEGDMVVTQAFRPDGSVGGSKKFKEIKPKGLSYKIKIIAETSDYLVINKPAGILVHPTEHGHEITLVDWLIKKYPEIKKVKDLSAIAPTQGGATADKRPGIVHRLDRDVSGLLVIAKTQKMFDWLKKQFQTRQIQKEYLALVYGQVKLDQGEIKRPVERSKKTGLMIARTDELADENSKEAITKFQVEKKFFNYTLVRLFLITGRTHQIRVHLKSIGHSIVGDQLYHTRNVKFKKIQKEIKNPFLTSVKLGFFDLKNNWQEFQIKPPAPLTKFLKGIK